MTDEVAAERAARRARGGVLGDAQFRGEHAAVSGHGVRGRVEGEHEDAMRRGCRPVRTGGEARRPRATRDRRPRARRAVRRGTGRRKTRTAPGRPWTRRPGRARVPPPPGRCPGARDRTSAGAGTSTRRPASNPATRARSAWAPHPGRARFGPIGCRTSFPRERERGANRRVARHGQLARLGEDSQARQGAGRSSRPDEDRFGKRHLAGDGLHDLVGEVGRVEDDRQLVAFQAAAREDVEVEVGVKGHNGVRRTAYGGGATCRATTACLTGGRQRHPDRCRGRRPAG